MSTQINRRRFERFALNPGYTPVVVRTIGAKPKTLDGHSHDICEGGVRFELDVAVKPGTPVSIEITLPIDPRDPDSATLPGRRVSAYGVIAWVDESEPGPAQMAATFERFAQAGDRDRLLGRLTRRQLNRAV